MTNQTKNPPVATHRDGAVSSKVWRNMTKDGEPYYTVSFQRTYTDPTTQKPMESRTFGGTDVLKIQQLASASYRSIGQFREQDKANRNHEQQHTVDPQTPEHQPQLGLAEQRDAAMTGAVPSQNQNPAHQPTLER